MAIIHNDDVSQAAGGELGATVQVADLNERNQREIERLGYEGDEFAYKPESFVGNHLMKTVTPKACCWRVSPCLRWQQTWHGAMPIFIVCISRPAPACISAGAVRL